MRRRRNDKELMELIFIIVTGVLIALGFYIIWLAIPTQAAPIAGATQTIYQVHVKPPICKWQQDILETINEEPTKEETKDDKDDRKRQGSTEKRTVSNAQSNTRHRNHLTRQLGVFEGPSGRETFYNLPMGGVIRNMGALGFNYPYNIRSDGVKCLGPYVMCAADLGIRPKGTIVETSLGTGIVCDTGEFCQNNKYQLDIATTW